VLFLSQINDISLEVGARERGRTTATTMDDAMRENPD
jgi:hypothetical protein